MHYNCLNEAMSCKMSVMPKAGMLGTMYVGSDRYIVICAKVLSPKRVMVLEHKWCSAYESLIQEIDGCQFLPIDLVNKLYEEDYPNTKKEFEDEKNWWIETGREFSEDDIRTHVNNRLKYYLKEHTYSLRKNMRWMPQNRGAWDTGSIHWGFGDEYLDPSF